MHWEWVFLLLNTTILAGMATSLQKISILKQDITFLGVHKKGSFPQKILWMKFILAM